MKIERAVMPDSRSAEFNHLAWLLLRSGGSMPDARAIAETDRRYPTPSAVTDVLKAGVAVSELSEAAAFRGLRSAFTDSLRQVGVFDALLGGGMASLPFKTRVLAASTTATGDLVSEGEPKPVSRLALAADTIVPRKTTSIIVVSNESLEAAPGGTMTFIGRELRNAVVTATDEAFLVGLAAGVTPITSTAPVADLKALFAAVSLGTTSRPFIVVPTDVALGLAVAVDTGGAFLFPQATATGGSVMGTPILVSDTIAPATMMMIDAAGIVAADEPIRLDVSQHASIQMDDAPATGPTSQTSMWQTDCSALRTERVFGWHLVRADAVAMVDTIGWV